jgi:hypothetical protein
MRSIWQPIVHEGGGIGLRAGSSYGYSQLRLENRNSGCCSSCFLDSGEVREENLKCWVALAWWHEACGWPGGCG